MSAGVLLQAGWVSGDEGEGAWAGGWCGCLRVERVDGGRGVRGGRGGGKVWIWECREDGTREPNSKIPVLQNGLKDTGRVR